MLHVFKIEQTKSLTLCNVTATITRDAEHYDNSADNHAELVRVSTGRYKSVKPIHLFSDFPLSAVTSVLL